MTRKNKRFSVISELFISSLLLLTGCTHPAQQPQKEDAGLPVTYAYYSKNVKDTFSISVQLPLEYKDQPKKRYPVVVLTDANFYFPMLAQVLHQYEQGGLLPPLILVGVGYKSFKLMDSLRVRDYLYPAAIPSDEMKAPGGAFNYYNFITGELLPKIDSSYRTKAVDRTLLGHSFGGFFSLFALLEQTERKRNDFSAFVSASPSLWYNNNYLFQLPGKLHTSPPRDTISIFLSAGGMEMPVKWTVDPVKEMLKQLNAVHPAKIKVGAEIYSNLDHMDAGLIAFIKGLEHSYAKP